MFRNPAGTRAILGGLGCIAASAFLISVAPLSPLGHGSGRLSLTDPGSEDAFTCAGGKEIVLYVQVKDLEFQAVGELVQAHDRDFTVRANLTQIFARLTPDARGEGEFRPGDIIKTSGSISEDGTFQADEIAPACNAVTASEITGTPTPAAGSSDARPAFASPTGSSPSESSTLEGSPSPAATGPEAPATPRASGQPRLTAPAQPTPPDQPTPPPDTPPPVTPPLETPPPEPTAPPETPTASAQ